MIVLIKSLTFFPKVTVLSQYYLLCHETTDFSVTQAAKQSHFGMFSINKDYAVDMN